MEIKSFWLLCAALVATLHMHSVQSIDYESAKEGLACFEPETVKSDIAWFLSVKKWYYVAMSRLDLYSAATDMTGKAPKDITEDEVYYQGCVTWTVNAADMLFNAVGFNGVKRAYKMQPLDDTFGKIGFQAENGDLPGTMYIVLTDNKTFSLSAQCLDELNQMAWTVASPYKSLPKKTMKLIHDHLKTLGFKQEHFTGLRYDHCKDDDDSKVEDDIGKSEL